MTQSWMEIEDQSQLKTYKKFPMSLARGEGVWVETTEGERFFDLYGGHAVVCTGHCHPKVVAAIQKQASELIFYSNVMYNETRGRAAQALCGVAPKGMKNAFFINSGAEANDNAMKLARKATGRSVILSFEGGFHGRTIGTLSAAGDAKYRDSFPPNVPGHIVAPFGDLDAVSALMEEHKDDIAGVIIEPIQSMAGCRMAEPAFYQGLRALCDKYGAKLLYDEIQTGMGRTGTYFFAGRYGVMPDVIALAKSIASGIPMGALLVSDEIASFIGYGDLGTTFGAGPIASAAMHATLDVIAEENLLDNINTESAYLKEQLMQSDYVVNVHGLGFLMGIELTVPAADMTKALREKHIITGTSQHPNIMRLLPPYVLKRADIQQFLDVFSTIEV
jgi:acetylornithine/succinyldiaminopimelate/putrescine aminotransferase